MTTANGNQVIKEARSAAIAFEDVVLGRPESKRIDTPSNCLHYRVTPYAMSPGWFGCIEIYMMETIGSEPVVRVDVSSLDSTRIVSPADVLAVGEAMIAASRIAAHLKSALSQAQIRSTH
jgi:hypothetical protein